MNRVLFCAPLALCGITPAMLSASFTAPRPVATFLVAHLVLFAGGPAAVVALTAGAVLWLRRFAAPEGRARLADPAARRPSRAAARPLRALPARPRRAIEAPHYTDGGAR